MRNNIWNKRIPTLLGLVLIIIGIATTSFLVNKGVIFVTKAGPSQDPQKIKITNISDNSFTITYTTEDKVFGSVNYGINDTFGQTALDDRDSLSKSVVPHNIHSITLNNLDPATTYYFSITSADNKFLDNNKPFSVTTGPSISASPSAQEPATGKVLLPDSSPPHEGIVYFTSPEGQTISTLIKSDGSYILPLNSFRSSDLSSYMDLSGKQLKMLIIGDSQSSNVTLSLGQINPVPTITLSNNYDFTTSSSPVSSDSAKIASSSGFPSVQTTSNTQSSDPIITSPSKDQGLSDSQPEFSGKALPNEVVTVTIHSDTPIQAQVTTDANGNWQYRPTTPLAPGQHTISIQTKNSQGIIKTITQSFTVYASGNQIADATLSITPTPSPTITPSPSTTPSITPTLSPTPLITPSISPTPIASDSSFPSLSPSPSSPSGSMLPPAGGNFLGIGILGIGIAIIGTLMFFLTKGGLTL